MVKSSKSIIYNLLQECDVPLVEIPRYTRCLFSHTRCSLNHPKLVKPKRVCSHIDTEIVRNKDAYEAGGISVPAPYQLFISFRYYRACDNLGVKSVHLVALVRIPLLLRYVKPKQ